MNTHKRLLTSAVIAVLFTAAAATAADMQKSDETRHRALRSDDVDDEALLPAVSSVIEEIVPIGHNTVSVNWKRGSGAGNAVFATDRETTPPQPETGITYTADSVFGNGSRIGESRWFCVYNGDADETGVSGLTPSTEYRFAVIDYNGSAGHERYLADSTVAMSSVTTGAFPPPPEKKPQEITFTLSGKMETDQPPLKLDATSVSGLPVTFKSSDTSIAKIIQDDLHVLKPGSVTITASQAGDSVWTPAADVAQTITVTAIQQAAATEENAVPPPEKRFRKKRPLLLAAGGTVVAGIIIGVVVLAGSEKSSTGTETGLDDDRPPSDPATALGGN